MLGPSFIPCFLLPASCFHAASSHRQTIASAFPTARSPWASDGLFTTSKPVGEAGRATTIAVDPPPSRLIASVAPSSSAIRADSRSVVPTLCPACRPSMVISKSRRPPMTRRQTLFTIVRATTIAVDPPPSRLIARSRRVPARSGPIRGVWCQRCAPPVGRRW